MAKSPDNLCMGRIWIQFLLLILISGSLQSAAALELFGVDLESTRRDELRDAAKNAGLVLIREGGEDNWFDIYDSTGILGSSRRFYLGFVKADQRFAFAEYEFSGLDQRQLMSDLTAKYGAAEVHGGQYMSDRRFRWQRDGVEIELRSDWRNYKTRLNYVIPVNMEALLAEQAVFKSQQAAATGQVSLY